MSSHGPVPPLFDWYGTDEFMFIDVFAVPVVAA